jgi:protein-disulfide isomerase/peroxiredoxin
MVQTLPVGAAAPDFSLTTSVQMTVSLGQYRGKRVMLLFLPTPVHDKLGEQLTRYQENIQVFEELNSVILAISEMSPERLQQLAAARHIQFILLSDPSRNVWRQYTLADRDAPMETTAFGIDEQGLIRVVYEAAHNPNLPGPLALARALRKLNDVPRPAPITTNDWRIGTSDAPVTVIEYSDYQCQHCRALLHVLEQLVMTYGDTLQVVHRHLPLRQTHPLAQLAAEAAECAGAQNKFWEMHHRLFAADGALERDDLVGYARELDLDVERFTRDLDTHSFEHKVNGDWRQAVQSRIKLPPTLFINSILFEGPRTVTALSARIDSFLESAKRR